MFDSLQFNHAVGVGQVGARLAMSLRQVLTLDVQQIASSGHCCPIVTRTVHKLLLQHLTMVFATARLLRRRRIIILKLLPRRASDLSPCET